MKIEIIFKNSSNWFNRYAEVEGSEIIISACFDDPLSWPYTLKRYSVEDYSERTEEANIKLPKELYLKIKAIIASHTELVSCKEHVENAVSDGQDDAYYFACDSFSKEIFGASIYSVGSFEEEDYPKIPRTTNYHVYRTVKDIEEALSSAGVSMWG